MDKETIQKVYSLIKTAQRMINQAKDILLEALGEKEESKALNLESGSVGVQSQIVPANTDKEYVVYGIFNGEKMIGDDGKEYPVPPNYASKSKLVFGDRLKFYISEGKPKFKIVEPVERKWAVGELIEQGEEYKVAAEGKIYSVIFASVTYYKISPGDKVSIILPKNIESGWATIDSVVPK